MPTSQVPAKLDPKTAATVRAWLEVHRGDAESLACWMRDALRVGTLRQCRAMVAEATR